MGYKDEKVGMRTGQGVGTLCSDFAIQLEAEIKTAWSLIS